MAKLKRKSRHSPAGLRWLETERIRKLKGKKKIAYYGQGRETADDILRRIKRR